MKLSRLFAGAALLGSVLLACSSCGGGAKSDEQYALELHKVAPVPDAEMAARAGASLEHIGLGHTIFERKCLECHEARVPKNPADPNWHPVMEGMTWNAGLSERERSAVLAYLRAALRR